MLRSLARAGSERDLPDVDRLAIYSEPVMNALACGVRLLGGKGRCRIRAVASRLAS